MERNAYIVDVEKNRGINILRGALFCSYAIFVFFLIANIASANPVFIPAIINNSIFLAVNIVTIILLFKGYFNKAKFVFLISLVVALSFLSIVNYGPKPGLHFYFIVFAFLPLPMWSLRKRVFPICYFVLNISLFIYVEFFKDKLSVLVNFPDPLVVPMRVVTVVFALASIYAVFYSFFLANESKEVELREQHSKLNSLNNELLLKQNEINEQKQNLEKLNAELEVRNLSLSEKTDELLNANKTKDLLFSVIAHDLKNPLNALVGFSELMYTRIDNLDKDKMKKMTGMVLQSSVNMKNLTTNLLDWSRTQLHTIKVN